MEVIALTFIMFALFLIAGNLHNISIVIKDQTKAITESNKQD